MKINIASKQNHIFRENSFSPDFEDFEYASGRSAAGRRKFDDEFGASDDSGHGRSTEMSGNATRGKDLGLLDQ